MEKSQLGSRIWSRTAAILYTSILFVFLSPRSAALAQTSDVDLALSNLNLTAGTETNFIYSFDLTNNGTSPVQGYCMKLTFSSNNTIDEADYFTIIVPASDAAAQWIGPSQTLLKSEHFYAASPAGYLPTGTWYIIAEINYDKATSESSYDNNAVTSINSITVAPYELNFTTPPVVTDITASSFAIEATFDFPITGIYYRYQPNGTAPPDKDAVRSSGILFSGDSKVVIDGLGPAFQYVVYCMGESYDRNTTAIYKIDVTTAGTADPTLIAAEHEINLYPAAINTMSEPAVFSFSGYHLSGNVFLTPSPKFLVSKDDMGYAEQVSFEPGDFANGTVAEVYIISKEFDSAGIKTGTLVLESSEAEPVTINITIPIFNPQDSDFDGITSLRESGWSSYSVAGFQTWTLIDLAETSINQRANGEDWAMQIDGTINGSAENEDWLISPSVDLSRYAFHPTLMFRSYSSGPGEPLKLIYSADYAGYGDPRNATWFDTEIEFPAVNSNKWETSRIALFNREKDIHFAFIYNATPDEGSRWTVDDWRITDALVEIPSDILSYEEVPVGSNSESKEMVIEVVGYGDVTVTASAGFQVSLDDVDFATSVTVLENEVMVGKTIYVRFTPFSEADKFTGTLTFTATGLSVTNEQLVGSTSTVTAAEKNLRDCMARSTTTGITGPKAYQQPSQG